MEEGDHIPEYDSIVMSRYTEALRLDVTRGSLVSDELGQIVPIQKELENVPSSISLSSLLEQCELRETPVDDDSLLLAYYRKYGVELEPSDVKSTILQQLQQIKAYSDITEVEGLDSLYRQAKEREGRRKKNDHRIAREVLEMQEQLRSSWNLGGYFARTDLTIDTTSHMFRPTSPNGSSIGIREGQYIFNEAICSQYLPYIQYNNSLGESYYKIYSGTDYNKTPNYARITVSRSRRPQPNTFQMTLWLGDPYNVSPFSFYTADADTFFSVNFDLNSGELLVDTPSSIRWNENMDLLELLRLRTEEVLPLILGAHTIVGIKGMVELVPIYQLYTAPLGSQLELTNKGQFNLNNSVLSHIVLNEPIFSRHIYMEESNSPLALREKFVLRYRPPFTRLSNRSRIRGSHYTTVVFTPKVYQDDEISRVTVWRNNEWVQVMLPSRYARLRIRINNSTSIEDIDNCIHHMMPLFNIYQWGKCTHSENQLRIISLPGIALQPTIPTSKLFERLYSTLIPESPFIVEGSTVDEEERTFERIKRQRMQNRALQLIQTYPQVFGNRYSSTCGGERQPLAFNNEREAIQYSKNEYTRGGKTFERTYAQFPPPPKDPIFWFVCPSDTYPIPNLIENKGINVSQFPYLPCCTMTRSEKDRYSIYYEGIEKEAFMLRTRLNTGQLLTPGRHGRLPLALERLLSSVIGSEGELNHYGVDRSPSSLLHSILLAVNDGYYKSILGTTGDEREEYVRKKREELIKLIDPSLLKQEMYDANDEVIRQEISNPYTVLDPLLHYRMFEELYNINIFTFIPTGSQLTDIELEIPRHRYYHARPRREDRPTLLIYKYQGTESNTFRYPQCDIIIVRYEENKTDRRLFEGKMTSYCYDMLYRLHRVITSQFDLCGSTPSVSAGAGASPSTSRPSSSPSIPVAPQGIEASAVGIFPSSLCSTAAPESEEKILESCPLLPSKSYQNLHNFYNFTSIIPSMVNQYVDSNGKAQAFTFIFKKRYFITLIVPPTQPANLPHSSSISSCEIELVTDILGGHPSAVVRCGMYYCGLWYPLHGLEYGIYCPIQHPKKIAALNILKNMKEGPPPPLKITSGLENIQMSLNPSVVPSTSWGSIGSPSSSIVAPITSTGSQLSQVMRLGRLRRSLSLIRQLIQWTFDVWRTDGGINQKQPRKDTNDDYLTFSTQYFAVDQDATGSNVDSLKYYNFGELPNVLPNLDELDDMASELNLSTTEATINYIGSKVPSLIAEGAFVMYNVEFYLNMQDDLRRYSHASFNASIQLPLSLEDHYISEDDFGTVPGVNVLLGTKELEKWLESQNNTTNVTVITDKLSLFDVTGFAPILHRTQDGKLYIIQNTIDGRMETAAAIALKWQTKNYNPGPLVNSLGQVSNYVLYHININGHIVMHEDRHTSRPYLRILVFQGEGDRTGNMRKRHSAMLELA